MEHKEPKYMPKFIPFREEVLDNLSTSKNEKSPQVEIIRKWCDDFISTVKMDVKMVLLH